MTQAIKSSNPHDEGLPDSIVRKRRRARRFARIMITVGILTAVAGWLIFGSSIFSALKLEAESPYKAIIAYGLLMVSTLTLVLGFWYLLIAQVARVARMVEGDTAEESSRRTLCSNCGWFFDPPDRFCRHCGKPLARTEDIPPAVSRTP